MKYTLGPILSSELSEIGLGILKFVSVGRGCLTFYFEWEGKCDYLLFLRPHDKSVTFLESDTGTQPRAANDFSSKYDLRPWFPTYPARVPSCYSHYHTITGTNLHSTMYFMHKCKVIATVLSPLTWNSNPLISHMLQHEETQQLVNRLPSLGSFKHYNTTSRFFQNFFHISPSSSHIFGQFQSTGCWIQHKLILELINWLVSLNQGN